VATTIDVLIATRGRPEMLTGLLRSLDERAAQPARISVLVGVDDDDVATKQAEASLRRACGRLAFRMVSKPRPASVHDVYNGLIRDGSGDLIATLTDDVAVSTQGWDDIVEKTFAPFPDGLVIGSLVDALAPGAATLMAAPRRLPATLGYLLTDWFPFWWGDVWLDEIGALSGRRVVIPVDVVSLWENQGKGKTLRMRNISFWAAVFEMTRPVRQATADDLLHRIHGSDAAAITRIKQDWPAITARFQQANSALINPINAMDMEANWAAEPRELVAEKIALKRLRETFAQR
jgi:hypothetical protein